MTVLFEVARPGTEAMLNAMWQGIALGAVVWLLLRATPRASASTRHAVWFAALSAVVFLPLLPLIGLLPVGGAAPPGSGAMGASLPAVWLPLSENWVLVIFAFWFLGATAMLARLAWSYRLARGVRGRCRPLAGRPQERLALCREAAGCRRPVRLLASDELSTPVTIGLGEPAIVVPEFLAVRLPEADLDKVLLHELGHIRRRDDWTNLVQRVAQALFFYHPAVHWIARHLELEREIACDDWVVAVTGDARPYAACLTHLAELRAARPRLQAALGAVVRKPHISTRIELLMRRPRRGARSFSRAGLLGASGALAATAALFLQAPRVTLASPEAPALEIAEVRPSVPAGALAQTPRPPAGEDEGPRRSAPAVRKRPAVPQPAPEREMAAAPEQSGRRPRPVQAGGLYLSVTFGTADGVILIQRWRTFRSGNRTIAEENWVLILVPWERPETDPGLDQV
jgi:beta-lactamase regulating signal transducer with metallopeptidase domain